MTDSPKSLSLASLLTQIKSCSSHLNVKGPWFMIQTILPFDSKLPFQLSLSLITPASPSNQSSTFLSQCHLHQPMTFSVCSNSLAFFSIPEKPFSPKSTSHILTHLFKGSLKFHFIWKTSYSDCAVLSLLCSPSMIFTFVSWVFIHPVYVFHNSVV